VRCHKQILKEGAEGEEKKTSVRAPKVSSL